MRKKQPQQKWVYKPTAPKFKPGEKEKMLIKAKERIEGFPKLSQKVSRVHMHGNRIYLYELVEQIKEAGAVYIKPLIDGKYLEFPYARITLNDIKGDNCTVDWQRHNDKWITLYTGTLEECLANIENDTGWFGE